MWTSAQNVSVNDNVMFKRGRDGGMQKAESRKAETLESEKGGRDYGEKLKLGKQKAESWGRDEG